jgi:sugar/nucleoside kinase (ribokinase family)
MPDVLLVGDLLTDLLVATDGPPVAGSDTPGTIRAAGGGQAANTAAWLVACGSTATLVAAVGADPAGRDRVAELTAAGVRCAVATVPDAATGTILVLTAAGDRTMVTDRAAAGRLTVAAVDAGFAAAPDAGHLHVSGYALLDAGSRDAARHALREARRRGLTTSVDAASAAPLRTAGTAFTDWVRGTDLLLANTDEAVLLPDPPVTHLILKDGANGARWRTADHEWSTPAVPARAVDVTGAGDAFAAGLLHSWLTDGVPRHALQAAARAGAAAVRRLGARP